jgi:hypothetical protein
LAAVLFVLPRFTVVVKRFVSIKNLSILPGKLVGLFFDLSF